MKFEELAKTFSLKELPQSEVELAGEVPADAIAEYRARALTHVAEHLELPGFRKGHVPHEVAAKKVGEMALLEEQVELLMQEFYPALVAAQKIDAVGRPDIRITKLAPGNPAALVIRTAVYPQVKLADGWKEIAEKIPSEIVEEIKGEKPEDRQKREFLAKDKRRGKIVDALVEKVSVVVPHIFVESELEKIIAQMREDIGRMGMKYEDFLKHSGKTEDTVRGEFREQAKKRALIQLTLNKIAEEEKVEPEEEAVEVEMKHALEHFPDAKPGLLRIHIHSVLRNEKVLRMLEGETK